MQSKTPPSPHCLGSKAHVNVICASQLSAHNDAEASPSEFEHANQMMQQQGVRHVQNIPKLIFTLWASISTHHCPLFLSSPFHNDTFTLKTQSSSQLHLSVPNAQINRPSHKRGNRHWRAQPSADK
jgi:hypothetical protein